MSKLVSSQPLSASTLTVITGPMFSGKSLHLTRAISACTRESITCITVDSGDGTPLAIASRADGTAFPAQAWAARPFQHLSQIAQDGKSMRGHAVFIDEGQFHAGLCAYCVALLRAGADVHVAGLQYNWRGDVFEHSEIPRLTGYVCISGNGYMDIAVYCRIRCSTDCFYKEHVPEYPGDAEYTTRLNESGWGLPGESGTFVKERCLKTQMPEGDVYVPCCRMHTINYVGNPGAEFYHSNIAQPRWHRWHIPGTAEQAAAEPDVYRTPRMFARMERWTRRTEIE